MSLGVELTNYSQEENNKDQGPTCFLYCVCISFCLFAKKAKERERDHNGENNEESFKCRQVSECRRTRSIASLRRAKLPHEQKQEIQYPKLITCRYFSVSFPSIHLFQWTPPLPSNFYHYHTPHHVVALE